MKKAKKLALIILDGWGYGKRDESDAVFQAQTPVFDELIKSNPNATLVTDGEKVGLPKGQMGNSEVGHLNIGAGRVVYQELVRINRAIESGELAKNQTLINAFQYANERKKAVHFIGLVSNGGIHSHQNHLIALCQMAKELKVERSYIHAFTDGRDTDPHSAKGFIETVEEAIRETPTKIASLVGRYYAMDRDLRWERIKLAYDLLTKGKGEKFETAKEGIEASYQAGITDEFIKPIAISDKQGNALTKVQEGDVVISFNFRTDRCRQITRALHQEDFPENGMQKMNLHYLTMTNYNDSFEDVKVIFKKNNLENTLGEMLSKANKKQIRIAETEKYPHVTFFFSGGREKVFEGEKRIMVNSPKVATYDLQPEMSAGEVTDKIVEEIKTEWADFICLNFANPDMVGHTGVREAIVKAVETVDSCLGKIVETGKSHDYSFIIIADHGNADYIVNNDGSPHTAHTTNPVPIILVDGNNDQIKSGKLADVAPTILSLMGLKIPEEMNGEVLIY